MKITIPCNGMFSFCSFRNNYIKQFHLTKHVSYMFTNCLVNVNPVLTRKGDYTHKLSSNPNISHPSLKNCIRFSALSSDANFQVQSLWEVNENDGDGAKNELENYKAETTTLRKEACDQELHLVNLIKQNINRANQLAIKDWEGIKKTTLKMPGNIYDENIDAHIMNICSELRGLALGKSYYKYLKSTNTTINRATFGSYLRLFYLCAQDCTDSDLQEIYTVYKKLIEVYPIIDCYTAEKAVSALSITKYWKEYEHLFNIIEMSYAPSINVYTVVIIAAFKNKEFDLGWKLINDMKHRGLKVLEDVYFSWLDVQSIENREKSVTVLLDFFVKYNFKPSVKLCEYLKQILEEFPVNKRGVWTSITRRGNCKNCHGLLEKAWVKEEEFNQLKKAFLNPVLIGKDIFLKTQPQEFKEFLTFLKKTAPYDVVLDGLNIAFNAHKSRRSTSVYAFQLKSVVKKFVSEDKKVLVIGRKHMLKWPKQDMQHVFTDAKVFLAEDISHDDPFLLYATLFSGLGTMFVSRDMMRGHKFLLADPLLQAIFLKWQAQHQYFIKYIENNGYVHLNDPIPYMQNIQHNSRGDWHIPYTLKEELTNKSMVDNLHNHWLCVSSPSVRQLPFRPDISNHGNPKMGRGFSPNNSQTENYKRRR